MYSRKTNKSSCLLFCYLLNIFIDHFAAVKHSLSSYHFYRVLSPHNNYLKMMLKCVILLCAINCAFSFYVGEYVPRSFYKIHNGQKSPTFYIDVNSLDPILRNRREIISGTFEGKIDSDPYEEDVVPRLIYGDTGN
ncbi:uncharacterized protein LOC108741706 [Agrilus planipennis]|uniref:Uncharacterized protein LOC108741706 n=1 Tax=Agrilus planipennis TaxID=224129 RepID=A0A1W4XI98_AGRPL|nr:uncharacterized protein LOC108741706 [Agrilus planipennis]